MCIYIYIEICIHMLYMGGTATRRAADWSAPLHAEDLAEDPQCAAQLQRGLSHTADVPEPRPVRSIRLLWFLGLQRHPTLRVYVPHVQPFCGEVCGILCEVLHSWERWMRCPASLEPFGCGSGSIPSPTRSGSFSSSCATRAPTQERVATIFVTGGDMGTHIAVRLTGETDPGVAVNRRMARKRWVVPPW